ncbi:MAG: CHAT domain-containing protein [Chloroflexota bacterium]
MADYADLEIRILEKQQEGYPVEMTLNNEQQFQRGYLDPGFLDNWLLSSNPAKDGERLFNWLMAEDALKVAWAEMRGQRPQRRIRLRIDASAPELHAIPWELLRDAADGGPAQDLAATNATPFSRYLAGRWLPGGPIFQRPVKVLVAIANPENLADYEDLAAVEVEKEWQLLQEATAGQDDIQLTLLDQPCTLANIEEALKEGYHVLHFIGHGAYRERGGQGTAVLYLADDQNQVALARDEDIASMLDRQLSHSDLVVDDRLRLVFLASCQTATRNPADAFRGLAPRLIAAGVPAVVAMQDLVPVDTARQFASTFYRQLLVHGQVDLASNEARSALLTAKLSGAAIPVLFSRLRSNQLLGKKGQISGDKTEEDFWPFFLENVDLGRVTVFLGPGVTNGLLPDRETVALKLAEKYGYPMSDNSSLIKVAQFMALKDPALLRSDYMRTLQRSLFNYLDITPTKEQKRQFRNASLCETIEAIGWSECVLKIHENEIHHELAALGLPLYVTTNVDNFMVEALKQQEGVSPRRIGLRWEQPGAGTPQYVITPEPSAKEPVVLHLNGHDGDPEQMRHLVLSEDDYLEHFVRLSRDQEIVLPMNVLGMLAERSFLFLGYRLDDWELRVILQGLTKQIAETSRDRKTHIGVQLEMEDELTNEEAINYLQRYMQEFNVDIYWGSTKQFVNELTKRWQDYLEAEDDEW